MTSPRPSANLRRSSSRSRSADAASSRGEGLIEQQDPGLVEQRAGYRGPLGESATQSPGRLVRPGWPSRPLPARRETPRADAPDRRAGREHQVLEQREVVVQQRLVGHEAERRAVPRRRLEPAAARAPGPRRTSAASGRRAAEAAWSSPLRWAPLRPALRPARGPDRCPGVLACARRTAEVRGPRAEGRQRTASMRAPSSSRRKGLTM